MIKNCGKATIDNIRRSLSTFFSWLEEEDYIIKSPMIDLQRKRRYNKRKMGVYSMGKTATLNATAIDMYLKQISLVGGIPLHIPLHREANSA